VYYKYITRINPKSGALERPWRTRDHLFVLGDPAKGSVRHHDEHAVKVDNYGEALELVERGFSIRMSDGKSAPNLVVPSSLTISDWPGGHLDDLWTYTMPDLPFSREALEQDIRVALLSFAGDIYWVASPDAADAFIGFELNESELNADPEQGSLPARIDLSRFFFARVAFIAYERAFRICAPKTNVEEDIHELAYVMTAVMRRGGHAYPSPASEKASPLYRTMMNAYLRWKVIECRSFTLDDSDERRSVLKPGQNIVETLSILSGMTEQAVRNSLAREKLSALEEKEDFFVLLRWLENRRDFFPLREEERPKAGETWDVLRKIESAPIRKALENVHAFFRQVNLDHALLSMLEAEIADLVESGAAVSDAKLRDYARALELNIDTFVLNFPEAAEKGRQAARRRVSA
jgi:hypothetical protein